MSVGSPVVLNIAAGTVVNCEFLRLSVGRYNHIGPQKWF